MRRPLKCSPRCSVWLSYLANMSKARKLFRLFKSVNEYHTLMAFLDDCSDGMPQLVLGVITRLGLFVYWIFDNLQVLTMINFLKGNPDNYKRIGMMGWFFSLLATVINHLMKLYEKYEGLAQDAAALERAKARGPDGKDRVEMLLKTKAIKQAQIFSSYLAIIKSLGDLTTASAGSGIAKKIFKRQPNDGMIGVGGSISSVISLYSAWPGKK